MRIGRIVALGAILIVGASRIGRAESGDPEGVFLAVSCNTDGTYTCAGACPYEKGSDHYCHWCCISC